MSSQARGGWWRTVEPDEGAGGVRKTPDDILRVFSAINIRIDDSPLKASPPDKPETLPSLLAWSDEETVKSLQTAALSNHVISIRATGISTPSELDEAVKSMSFTLIGGINGTLVVGPFAAQVEEEGLMLWESGDGHYTRDTLNQLSFMERTTFYGRMMEMGRQGVRGVYIDPQVQLDALRTWLKLERNNAVNAYMKNNGETLQIEPRS